MAELQVTCVNKPDRSSPHEAITRLGGPTWRKSRLQVWDEIDQGTNRFYTYDGYKKAYLRTRISASGTKYVQTFADGDWKNNLLALTECV